MESHITTLTPNQSTFVESTLEERKDIVVQTQGEETHEPIVQSEDPEMLADELYQVALDKGIDEAFVELAEDRSEEKVAEETSSEAIEEEKMSDDMRFLQEENALLEQKVNALELKAKGLEEEKNTLEEQLRASELTVDKSLEVMLKLAEILKKLIEEEKEESKKVSLLEIFVETLTGFMQAAFVPGEDEALERKATKEAPERGGTSLKQKRIEMLRMLQTQRGVNIEIPAA